MANEVGSFTPAGTGARTIFLNNAALVPTLIEFEMGPRAGTNETYVTRSSGWADGTRQRCISIYDDNTTRTTRIDTSNVMTHYKNSSGIVVAEQFSLTSFATGQFTINVATNDTNFSVGYKVWS